MLLFTKYENIRGTPAKYCLQVNDLIHCILHVIDSLLSILFVVCSQQISEISCKKMKKKKKKQPKTKNGKEKTKTNLEIYMFQIVVFIAGKCCQMQQSFLIYGF